MRQKMRFKVAVFARLFFCLATISLAGAGAARPQDQTCTTTLTGKVFAPNNIDPLPNILVYVPTSAVQPFSNGVNSCSQSLQLVSGTPLVSSLTAADGSFSLTSSKLAGTNVPLVIQAGKWRRQVTVSNVAACATTTFSTRMPQTRDEGDIPHFAVVTGAADAVECALRKVGIKDSEFTNPDGPGRINFYLGSGFDSNPFAGDLVGAGATIDASTPSETVLTDNPALMNTYDIIMLPCEGSDRSGFQKTAAEQANLINYTNLGGRMFATHFSYVWLYNDPPFQGTANWTGTNKTFPDGDATISSSFADANVLSQWLVNVGASKTYGQVPIKTLKQNQTGVNPPTQSWFTLNDAAANNPVMQFTFDTPITGTQLPNVAIGLTNTPSNFLRGDTANQITINVSNTNPTAADASLTLHVALARGISAMSLAGANSTSGWACSLATLACNRTAPLPGNSADPLVLGVSVAPDAPLGNTGVATISIAGGGLSDTKQCGRVLFNEYHVETPVDTLAGKHFPNECPVTVSMSPQEKLLEYSLFDLSNFVAPVTVDTALVQAKPVIAWAAQAPVPYGTALSSVQLNASASVPGTFTYTPAAGTVLPPGANTLTVLFTPTDAASYTSGTASVTLNVSLLPTSLSLHLCVDGPASQFPCGNDLVNNPPPILSPITAFYGQIIDGVVIQSERNVNGQINFYAGTTLFCSISANTSAGSNVCPPTAGMFHAGTAPVTAVYSGDAFHAGSTSNVVVVAVLPDITSAVVTADLNPAAAGQLITLSANVSGNFATPVGPVNFLDGTTVIGTANLDASGAAVLTTSSLSLGVHSISIAYPGTPDFSPAASATLDLLVVPPPVILKSVVTLTASLNPAALHQPVTLTASVSAPGLLSALPSGTVHFLDGATILGSAPTDQFGVASIQTLSLATGSHALTATYDGVVGTPARTPVKPPSPPKPVSPSVVRVPLGIRVAGQSTVQTNPAARPFSSGISGAASASAKSSEGAAPNAVHPRAHSSLASPRAVISVLPTILPGTSPILTEVVLAALPADQAGFVVTVTPAPITVGAGRTGILLVSVRAASGFSQPVQLSCANLAPETTCTFVQPILPAGGGSTTLQLATSAPHDCNTSNPYFLGKADSAPLSPSNTKPLAAALVATVFLLFLPRRARRLRRVRLLQTFLLTAALASGLTALSGCGHCTDLGTRPGAYSFTVVGTAQGASGASATQSAIGSQTSSQTVQLNIVLQ